jgi:hypothetical protein
MDLGRYQQGQVVNLEVTATDGGGSPAQPDAAPAATVSDADSNVVAVLKLAINLDETNFALPVFLGVGFPLGTYTVEYSWIIGGVSGSGSDTFDVIHGGDVGGGVISMFAYDRPEARYVVAQLSSGNLVQGRNPKF